MSKYLKLVSSASEVPVNEDNPIPPASVWYDGEKVYFFPKESIDPKKSMIYTTIDGKSYNIEFCNNIEFYQDLGRRTEVQIKKNTYTSEQGVLTFEEEVVCIAYASDGGGTNGNDKVTSIVFPSGLNYILSTNAEGPFNNYTKLAEITLPATMTGILENNFKGCPLLTTINYGGTMAQWNELVGEKVIAENLSVVHCSDGDITV